MEVKNTFKLPLEKLPLDVARLDYQTALCTDYIIKQALKMFLLITLVVLLLISTVKLQSSCCSVNNNININASYCDETLLQEVSFSSVSITIS